MNENKVRISMTIDPELLERVDVVCEAMGAKRSSLIERLIKFGIEDRERFVRDMENPINRMFASAMSKSPVLVEAVLQAAGDEIDDELRKWLREGLREQIERGKQRVVKKKGKKKVSRAKVKPA